MVVRRTALVWWVASTLAKKSPLDAATTFGSHQVPLSEVECFIFDAEGTLLDSVEWYHTPWNVAGETYDVHLSRIDFYRWWGLPIREIGNNAMARARGADPAAVEYGGYPRIPHRVFTMGPVADVYTELYMKRQLGHAMVATPPKPIGAVLKMVEEAKKVAADAKRVRTALATTGLPTHPFLPYVAPHFSHISHFILVFMSSFALLPYTLRPALPFPTPAHILPSRCLDPACKPGMSRPLSPLPLSPPSLPTPLPSPPPLTPSSNPLL